MSLYDQVLLTEIFQHTFVTLTLTLTLPAFQGRDDAVSRAEGTSAVPGVLAPGLPTV